MNILQTLDHSENLYQVDLLRLPKHQQRELSLYFASVTGNEVDVRPPVCRSALTMFCGMYQGLCQISSSDSIHTCESPFPND